MKLRMKKVSFFVVSCILVTMIFCMVVGRQIEANDVQQVNNEEVGEIVSKKAYSDDFDVVKAKTELMELHKDEYVDMSELEKEKYLEDIYAIFQNGYSQEVIDGILEKNGVYLLQVPDEEGAEYVASDGSYISLNKPKIYYYSKLGYWGIYASGCYTKFPDDIDWTDVFWPTVGKRYNIGSPDCYGYTIEDISGTYSSSLVSAKCMISVSGTPSGGVNVSSKTKKTGSGAYGVGFEIQDKAIIASSSILKYTYNYLGYSFGVMGWYNSEFVNYRGNVQTVYGHTWSSCEIKSFSIGLNAGVNSGGAQVSANCSMDFTKSGKNFTGTSFDTNLYKEGFNKVPKNVYYDSNFAP